VVMSGARCRSFACGPADATASPKPHHLLPHFNPDWYRLTQVVPEKRPLNGCSVVVVVVATVMGETTRIAAATEIDPSY